MLEFLRLQMAVHHPLGAVTEEEGALWGDQGVWARQLARMYCNVVDTPASGTAPGSCGGL